MVENFQTQDDIEIIFETDKPFSEETLGKTLGRFEWLVARQSAEFLLFLTNLDIAEGQTLDIFSAFQSAQSETRDFIETGFCAQDGDAEVVATHPLQETIQGLLDEVEDGLADKISDTLEDDKFAETGGYFDSLGAEADEEIIHRLQNLKEQYPAT